MARNFEFCRDVVVLVSEKTPKRYLEYLKDRNYDYQVTEEDQVDLREALELLASQYGVKTVVTDTGRILSNLLLDQGIPYEISLLIHPIVVGDKSYSMFSGVNKSVELKLRNKKIFDGYVWLVYDVVN
jgi:2,5-diamino-6-(ribosylamino)-4(3H)-pyrimidinone 5'-phosphate reductase